MHGADHGGKMRPAAIRQIVPVHRGDDHMLETKLLDRRGNIAGLGRIERPGHTGFDIAESTGARAGVAHDHDGGVLLAPAFADIGASRFLADGV